MPRWVQKLNKLAADWLDLPPDVTLELPRITMIGNRQMYIENHRGVEFFSAELLRLALANGALEIRGRKLVIRAIMPEEVLVEGIVDELKLVGMPTG
ncbi:sporulation protein YqfC [Paenibacillus thermoaerophilus]|uniref:Sporulation protein YqfC n=1 Tax=Paenibacillus thermoaerophilus TaxID=1215385 RepID=A0ABW2V1C8_9BACL|nr:sporulation protein YqfC [Paenibacillus thermoaerophilus]TMV19023.1 sporulation protein YqfC [Paenibacillus thermoaerophilus]